MTLPSLRRKGYAAAVTTPEIDVQQHLPQDQVLILALCERLPEQHAILQAGQISAHVLLDLVPARPQQRLMANLMRLDAARLIRPVRGAFPMDDARGRFAGIFGGQEGGITHWGPHGGMADSREAGKPSLLIAMSDQQHLHWSPSPWHRRGRWRGAAVLTVKFT